MNYSIVTDKVELKKFIDFLPELDGEETYYLCLFARNKYCREVKHISSDKAQLKRFVTNKERMFNKIKQLEVEVGEYYQYRNGIRTDIPQEALALYINPNPRSMRKAIISSIKKLLDIYETATEGYNIVQEVLSQVQKAKSRNVVYNVDFDIDKSRFQEVKDLVTTFGINGWWIETRGGYHYLVDLLTTEEKNWYQKFIQIEGVEMIKDTMLPVPGTYQGGFTPKFI
jgi:hypothetical protein